MSDETPPMPSSKSVTVTPDPVLVTGDVPTVEPTPEPTTTVETTVEVTKNTVGVGDFFIGIAKVFSWPWLREQTNTIQKFLNLTELAKSLTAWLVTGGGALALVEALSNNVDHVVTDPHYRGVAKAGVTVIISLIGFTSALKIHLNNGTPATSTPMVTTVVKTTEPLKPQPQSSVTPK